MSQSNTPSIVKHLSEAVVKASRIDAGLFEKYSVKRGLRNADHGGGNNSTFTIRVTSSKGTGTYSAVASALVSLKEPLHGGTSHEVLIAATYVINKKNASNE